MKTDEQRVLSGGSPISCSQHPSPRGTPAAAREMGLPAARHPLAFIRNFGAAIGFLTACPGMPHEPEHLRKSAVFFPWVGALLGAVLWLQYYFLAPHLSQGLNALGVVLAGAAWTKALHLDGLADTADALLSHRSKERMLEIMRDSRIGTMGALALIADILLRWQLLAALPVYFLPAALIAAPALGRMSMALGMALFPYARAEGMASVFQQQAQTAHLLILLFSGLFLAMLTASGTGMQLWSLSLLLSMGAFTWCRRRLGGYTGDILGAVNEIVELAILGLLAVMA